MLNDITQEATAYTEEDGSGGGAPAPPPPPPSMGAPPPPPPPPPLPGMPGLALPFGGLVPKPRIIPLVKLKQLHWVKIPEAKVKGTFERWAAPDRPTSHQQKSHATPSHLTLTTTLTLAPAALSILCHVVRGCYAARQKRCGAPCPTMRCCVVSWT